MESQPNKVWMWISLLAGAVGHPFYVFLAFMTAYGLEWYSEQGTNVVQLYFLPFLLLTLIIGGIRHWVTLKLMLWIWRNDDPNLVKKQYLRNQIPFFLFIPIFLFLGGTPQEGNIIGIIVIPLVVVADLLLGGIYWLMQMLTFIKLARTE